MNRRLTYTYIALCHEVVHYVDDGGLPSAGTKQVQATDGLQSCLSHPDGAGVQLSLTMVGLVPPLPYPIVLCACM